MATFVHNEPTCLPVIQEAGLPEAFYKLVEAGLEPVIEVIKAAFMILLILNKILGYTIGPERNRCTLP